MDPERVRKAFPGKRIIEIGGFKVGLIHGEGAPFGIESRIREAFDEVDAIVYGHTHTPAYHQVRGIYFFNPGSPTRLSVTQPTLGILHIDDKIWGEIIPL